MNPFGTTLSSVKRDHALITPDSHVTAPLPGWTDTEGTILISPAIGGSTRAQFSQYLAQMEVGASAGPPPTGVERFVYVLQGELKLSINRISEVLTAGDYAFIPADNDHRLTAESPAQINVFEKRFEPLEGHKAPPVVTGKSFDVKGEAFMGDEDAQLQTLLPNNADFDMAVNLFTFQPGTALPFVEIHIMEHGLLMTRGQGIYRLSDSWYPVQRGDVIWMAPFCPQWFAAVGKEPAAYLYYKNVNRDPLSAGE